MARRLRLIAMFTGVVLIAVGFAVMSSDGSLATSIVAIVVGLALLLGGLATRRRRRAPYDGRPAVIDPHKDAGASDGDSDGGDR